jgi:ABC-type multidrug transport system fused ATPase/permease subunit
MKDYYKVYSLLLGDSKSRFSILLLCVLGMAFLQTAGIASIAPFIAVLSTPELIQTNKYVAALYDNFNFTNLNSFLLFLGTGTLIVLIVSNIFSALTTRLLIRFTFLQGHALSQRLFKQYLSQPYIFFLNRNSADLLKNIITEIDRCVIGVFAPALDIIARSIITLFILSFLIAMDPRLALITLLVCGGSYALVYRISRRSLASSGKKAADSQSSRNKIVSEAFGGIKEIKLLGREANFFRVFEPRSHEFAMSLINSRSISELPKYALETIIFGGILLIMLYLIGVKQNMSGVLPLLALYAFAGYRLMPALQRIFAGLTAVRYYLPVLDKIFTDIHENYMENDLSMKYISESEILHFNDSLILQNISYNYPHSDNAVIKNLNLSIKANTTVGFVGSTGSGKTTLVDIILGLLPVNNGSFSIDGVSVDSNNVSNWQKNIGYVPQEIYLADDTVARNIAFGITDKEIDQQAVKRAAEIANIHEFVIQSLPKGYDSLIGERGVRLSGGQRQRIGIARALYSDPKVLILDEATSALDGTTESAIMEAIHNLYHKKTIIMIAHRITTVKECDAIYVMEEGTISRSGKYNELMATCEPFKNMAKSLNSETAKH